MRIDTFSVVLAQFIGAKFQKWAQKSHFFHRNTPQNIIRYFLYKGERSLKSLNINKQLFE